METSSPEKKRFTLEFHVITYAERCNEKETEMDQLFPSLRCGTSNTVTWEITAGAFHSKCRTLAAGHWLFGRSRVINLGCHLDLITDRFLFDLRPVEIWSETRLNLIRDPFKFDLRPF